MFDRVTLFEPEKMLLANATSLAPAVEDPPPIEASVKLAMLDRS